MADTALDFTGLKCPLPVLKARRALKQMAVGDEVVIIADDPASPLDFKHYCDTSGNQLIEQINQNEQFSFRIRKS